VISSYALTPLCIKRSISATTLKLYPLHDPGAMIRTLSSPALLLLK